MSVTKDITGRPGDVHETRRRPLWSVALTVVVVMIAAVAVSFAIYAIISVSR